MYEFEYMNEQQEELEGKDLEQMEMETEAVENTEVTEMQEILEDQEESGEGTEVQENPSDFYKREMAAAIKNGDTAKYNEASKNYKDAKAKEALGYSSKYNEVLKQNSKNYTKAALEVNEEKEETEDKKEALGYSSDYYEHRMEVAIKNGNKIALENAQRNYAKAKVREST